MPPCRCYRLWGETSWVSSKGVTPPSSLLLTHAPNHCPPCVSGFPRPSGLCRLLPAPAAQWLFPTLSLPIFPHVLGPLPRLPLKCIRSLLPPEHWPSPIEQRVGASQIIPTAISVGDQFTGLQSFHYVRAREFARLPDSSHPLNAARLPDCCRAAETSTTTPITVGYLPRAVVMLADQIRAIVSKGTFTPQDWQPCRLLRSMAGLLAPLSTLRSVPHDSPRMTRGQYGLLFLYCVGLSPFTPCRSPGAP